MFVSSVVEDSSLGETPDVSDVGVVVGFSSFALLLSITGIFSNYHNFYLFHSSLLLQSGWLRIRESLT